MAVKEPKFMQELHKIRAEMTREWKRMSPKEIADSLHASSVWFKAQMHAKTKHGRYAKHA